MKRGTPLRRQQIVQAHDRHLSRRQGLAPRSPTQARLYRSRSAFVAAMLEQRPWCEILVSWDVCQGRATEVDEILSRAQGGSILDPDNCQPVCRACHRYKHEHPAEAVERGWTIQRRGLQP